MSEASQPRQASMEIEGGYRHTEADARGNRFVLPTDGYEWKKYGQKFIQRIGKNSYFKCQKSGCVARKKAEWSTMEPESVRIVYEGVHNHTLPATGSSSSQSQAPSSSANQYNLLTQVFGNQSAPHHGHGN